MQNQPFWTSPASRTDGSSPHPCAEPIVLHASRVQNTHVHSRLLFFFPLACGADRSVLHQRAEPIVRPRTRMQKRPFCSALARRTNRSARHPGAEGTVCITPAFRTDRAALHPRAEPTVLHLNRVQNRQLCIAPVCIPDYFASHCGSEPTFPPPSACRTNRSG